MRFLSPTKVVLLVLLEQSLTEDLLEDQVQALIIYLLDAITQVHCFCTPKCIDVVLKNPLRPEHILLLLLYV